MNYISSQQLKSKSMFKHCLYIKNELDENKCYQFAKLCFVWNSKIFTRYTINGFMENSIVLLIS